MSKIQGADQFGSTYSVKTWTTDFSGSEPSGSGVPSGGAEVACGATLVWAGAMPAGSVPPEVAELPGTTGLGDMGGTVAGTPELPAPAGGVTTVVVAARSDKGDERIASAIRQMPKQREDNM